MELIHTDFAHGVATLTLNRPEALNAMSLDVWRLLGATLTDAAASSDVRCLLITGAGRAFSAGGDIKEMRPDRTPDEQRERLELINGVIAQLYRFPRPTVAAVNGVAAGNGCALALACDLVLAADSASFICSFIKLGLVPDGGASWLLARLVGQRRASELILTARRLPAGDALAWGMISDVLPEHELLDEARALAQSLAAGPAEALSLSKLLIAGAAECSFESGLEAEREAQARCVANPDYREGVSAFLEKRQARFR